VQEKVQELATIGQCTKLGRTAISLLDALADSSNACKLVGAQLSHPERDFHWRISRESYD
jgi:hypothetical protein